MEVSANNEGRMFDVFLSYRHREYASEASQLCLYLDELSVIAWYDKREIWQHPWIPVSDLEQMLEQGVRSSRLFLFFPTDDTFAPDHVPFVPRNNGSPPPKLIFNWQVWERQFAKEVLQAYKRESGPNLLWAQTGDIHPYFDLSHLAYLLAIAVDRKDNLESFWSKHLASHTSEEVDQFGIHKWHELSDRIPLPDIIDPDKPESRRNIIRSGELPLRRGLRSENEFVTWEEVRGISKAQP